MRERMVASDARTAGVFSQSRQRLLLLELVARESSLQEIAGKLQLPLNLAHYYVARLLKLGLVQVTREQPRAGRVIRHYRAVARSFFVPTHLGSQDPGKQLAAELRTSLDHARGYDSKDGTLYFTDDEMRPRMLRTQGATRAAVATESWHQLRLTKEDARLLTTELKALLSRFESRAGGKVGSYLAYCAVAPRASRRKRAVP